MADRKELSEAEDPWTGEISGPGRLRSMGNFRPGRLRSMGNFRPGKTAGKKETSAPRREGAGENFHRIGEPARHRRK